MPSSDALSVRVLGSLAAFCWSVLFVPQLYENYLRSSTTGLSCSMCFIWCLSGASCAAYLIHFSEDISLIIQYVLMTFGSALAIGQILLYDTLRRDSSDRPPYLKASLSTLLLLLFLTGVSASLVSLFSASRDSRVPLALGSILPSFGFAAGFLPQVRDVVVARSAGGYSAGLAVLDCAGCALASAALLLDGGDPVGIISYVVIFALQGVMLILKVRYPSKPTTTSNCESNYSSGSDNKKAEEGEDCL